MKAQDAGPETLLYRILQSPQFRGAPGHQTLLQFICGETQAGNLDVLHEHDIGVALFGMPPGYDVNEQPVVRQLAGEVRTRLGEYFQGPGRREPVRLVIPGVEYRAFFYETPAKELEAARILATDLFWAPYLQSPNRNYLVHGELDEGRIPIPEAYAIVRLAALFEKRDCPLEIRAVRSFELRDLKGVNLILTGTPEANSLLKVAAGKLPDKPVVRRFGETADAGVITIISAADPEGVLNGALRVTTESLLAHIKARGFPDSDFPIEFDLT